MHPNISLHTQHQISATSGPLVQGPALSPKSAQPLHSVRSVDTGVNQVGEVACPKHADKAIEYFCRVCQRLVCSRCMFESCNGHELSQLDEVTGIVRRNVADLRSLMQSTRTTNDGNVTYIEHKMNEIERMKEQQIYFIEYGFGEVIKKLEEKRD